MEAYTSFARVYDTFMDNIPYEEWCEYLTGLMREYGVRDGLVLDLGCGTGNMTELLAKAGYLHLCFYLCFFLLQQIVCHFIEERTQLNKRVKFHIRFLLYLYIELMNTFL